MNLIQIIRRYLSILGANLYYRFSKKYVIQKKAIVGYGAKLIGRNSIGSYSYFTGEMGLGSYIASRTRLYETKIGKFSSIGSHVHAVIGNHPTKNWVSTSPVFFSQNSPQNWTFSNEARFEEVKYSDAKGKFYITIGNDVWVGSNVCILNGVDIPDGCIIGMGTVVVRNCEPYGIYAGNPAKLIRYRFKPDEISFLQQLKWWNKPTGWIFAHSHLFNDIKALVEVVSEHEPGDLDTRIF